MNVFDIICSIWSILCICCCCWIGHTEKEELKASKSIGIKENGTDTRKKH